MTSVCGTPDDRPLRGIKEPRRVPKFCWVGWIASSVPRPSPPVPLVSWQSHDMLQGWLCRLIEWGESAVIE